MSLWEYIFHKTPQKTKGRLSDKTHGMSHTILWLFLSWLQTELLVEIASDKLVADSFTALIFHHAFCQQARPCNVHIDSLAEGSPWACPAHCLGSWHLGIHPASPLPPICSFFPIHSFTHSFAFWSASIYLFSVYDCTRYWWYKNQSCYLEFIKD